MSQIKVKASKSTIHVESSDDLVLSCKSGENETTIKVSTRKQQNGHDWRITKILYPSFVDVGPTKFQLGEIVLGKIKGFAPWPGFIKEIVGFEHKSTLEIIIEFFGDNTEHVIAPSNLMKYEENREEMQKNMNKMGYLRAVKEAELLIQFKKN